MASRKPEIRYSRTTLVVSDDRRPNQTLRKIHGAEYENPPTVHTVRCKNALSYRRSTMLANIPKRYIITFLIFIGSFLEQIIHLNLPIAIIAMSSNKTVNSANGTTIVPAEFHWTSIEKGFILGSFSGGNMFRFVGGYFAYRFGGMITVAVSSSISAIIEISSPFLFYQHLYVFLAGRVMLGLLNGITHIGMLEIFIHWSPISERTRLVTVQQWGMMVSALVNYPLSGFMAYYLSWQAMFYISGASLLMWTLVWLKYVKSDPADDKYVSDTERRYLQSNNPHLSRKKVEIPWKEIFSSITVYALINEFFCSSWYTSFITQGLPLYIKDVFNVNVRDVGLLTSVPMLCTVITLPVAAIAADYLRINKLGVAKVHKIYLFWGQLSILILLLIASFWGNFIVCMICFSIARVAYSFLLVSYGVIVIDVGGQFGSIIKSLATAGFQLGSFLNPVIFGYMVSHHTQTEWNLYFFVLSFISMYGVIMFLIFGSGELQPWAKAPESKEGENRSARL